MKRSQSEKSTSMAALEAAADSTAVALEAAADAASPGRSHDVRPDARWKKYRRPVRSS